jgi:hypothetical protein
MLGVKCKSERPQWPAHTWPTREWPHTSTKLCVTFHITFFCSCFLMLNRTFTVPCRYMITFVDLHIACGFEIAKLLIFVQKFDIIVFISLSSNASLRKTNSVLYSVLRSDKFCVLKYHCIVNNSDSLVLRLASTISKIYGCCISSGGIQICQIIPHYLQYSV